MEKGEDGLQIASAAAPFTVSVTSSTTTATALQPPSSNFAPVNLVSSSHSSDPELNDALNILLSDSGNKCAGEVSDEMPPYLFDLPSFLFPVGSLPSSTDMLSQGLTPTTSGLIFFLGTCAQVSLAAPAPRTQRSSRGGRRQTMHRHGSEPLVYHLCKTPVQETTDQEVGVESTTEHFLGNCQTRHTTLLSAVE